MNTYRPTPKSPMGKYFAAAMMIIIAIGVMLFLGKHSLNFFTWTFGSGDDIYAYLGLLLTSIGAVGWLLDFLYMADTDLRKTVAIVMTAISLLGELAAAGFDMYVSALGMINTTMTETDIRNMTIVVALLGFIHGVALVIYIAGDEIGHAWKGEKAIPADPQMPIIPARTEKYKFETPLDWRYIYPAGKEPIISPLPARTPHIIGKDEPTPAQDPFHSPKE